MRILIISKAGRMLGIAQRLQDEGHSVLFTIINTTSGQSEIGNGIVPKTEFGSESGEGCNLVVSEGYVPDLKRKGIPIFGGYRIAASVSGDVRQNASIMRLAGLELPLREAVDGIVLSVGAFWDGSQFAVPHLVWNDGDSKNYVKRINPNARLFTKGLGLLEHFLKKTDYRGYVRLRMMVAGDSVYGLGLNMAFEPDILQTLFELKKNDITGFLNSITIGRADEGEWHNGIAAGVRVFRNGYYDGVPVGGITPKNARHIWFQSVNKDTENSQQYHCVQTQLPLLYVTAGSNTLLPRRQKDAQVFAPRERETTSCKERIENTIHHVMINGMEYSTDMPEDISKKILEWL